MKTSFARRILVVDGHPVYINKLEGFLRGLTFSNVALASSGLEGLRIADEEPAALILLSGMLPDQSALEVCRALREKSPPSTRIIVQAGLFTSEEEKELFRQRGADLVLDRLEKNLHPLQEAVVSLLSSSFRDRPQ